MSLKVRNISRALTILARAEAAEFDLHADVDAFGAPSECHALVSRGEKQRWRNAVRHAKGVTGASYPQIKRAARDGGIPIGSPRWQGLVHRCIQFPG